MSTVTIPVGTEDYIRPSAAKQLSQCNGAAQMQAAFNDLVESFGLEEEDSAEAANGTACHDIVAKYMEAWKSDELKDFDMQAHIEAADCKLTSYDAWAIQASIGYAFNLIHTHNIDKENVLIEQHLPGDGIGYRNGGTADVVLVIPFDRVIVIDWKFGNNEQQEASINDQLAGYAVMASDCFHCNTVSVHIFQPKLEADRRATDALFNATALESARAWTLNIVDLATGENPELNPCYDACLYCDALIGCQAAKEWIMRVRQAQEMFGLDSPSERRELFEASKIAQKWGETTYKFMKKLEASQPGSVEGVKFRSTGSVHSMNTDDAMMAADEHDLMWQLTAAMKISVSDLRKQCDPTDFENVFQPLVSSKEKDPSLVLV